MRLLALVLLVGCGTSEPGVGGPVVDSPPNNGNLPSWQLTDVNPQSPRSGETYGLDTFTGKIIVVTLLEGF